MERNDVKRVWRLRALQFRLQFWSRPQDTLRAAIVINTCLVLNFSQISPSKKLHKLPFDTILTFPLFLLSSLCGWWMHTWSTNYKVTFTSSVNSLSLIIWKTLRYGPISSFIHKAQISRWGSNVEYMIVPNIPKIREKLEKVEVSRNLFEANRF